MGQQTTGNGRLPVVEVDQLLSEFEVSQHAVARTAQTGAPRAVGAEECRTGFDYAPKLGTIGGGFFVPLEFTPAAGEQPDFSPGWCCPRRSSSIRLAGNGSHTSSLRLRAKERELCLADLRKREQI
jgi:hypothetical protein